MILPTRIAGRARAVECAWPELLERHAGTIPRYPGPDLIDPVKVPAPPTLHGITDVTERARRVALAYQGAVQHRFKQEVWLLRGQLPVTATKWYPAFVETAEALLLRGIPPASWAAFSCDVWKDKHPRGPKGGLRPPPATWVCSAKRVAEREDWYYGEAQRYGGGKVVVGRVLTELLTRYAAMQRALMCALLTRPAVDRFLVHLCVEQHLPRDTYDHLVLRSQQEAVQIRQDLYRRMERGEMLW